MSFQKGPGLAHVQQRAKQYGKAIKEGGILALEKTVAEAAVSVQDKLEAATTPTGDARAERGGLPGRHDTGNMVGSVSHDDRSDVNTRSDQIWMRFGWWGANFESYFRDQDLGEGNIPAARALPDAQMQAEQDLHARLTSLMRGGVVE